MLRTWTDEQKQFLRENYGKLTYAEIADSLGKTVMQVTSQASNMKITKSRAYSDDDIKLLKVKYANTNTDEIAKLIGRDRMSVWRMAQKLGLKKDVEFIRETGRRHAQHPKAVATRFSKGSVPVNKGLRRPGWSAGRMSETQFKKGHKPQNWRPLGSERICPKDGYVLVKVSEGKALNYRHKHVVVWEAANGPVPGDHVVSFRDGNKQNCEIGNLELITRSELMKRNTFHNYPDDLKAQIHILAGFKRRLNNAKKQDRRP